RIFTDCWAAELPPSSQTGHVNAIVHTLEATRPQDKTRIGPLLDEVADRIGRRGIIILISDCLDDVEPTLNGLPHPRFRGHEVILFHVLHRDEVEFPLDGNIRFVGLEELGEIMTRPRLLRPTYQRIVGRFLDELRRGCENSGVDYIRLLTNRPLVTALGEYLIRRLQVTRR